MKKLLLLILSPFRKAVENSVSSKYEIVTNETECERLIYKIHYLPTLDHVIDFEIICDASISPANPFYSIIANAFYTKKQSFKVKVK